MRNLKTKHVLKKAGHRKYGRVLTIVSCHGDRDFDS